jgi:hypothetical protein
MRNIWFKYGSFELNQQQTINNVLQSCNLAYTFYNLILFCLKLSIFDLSILVFCTFLVPIMKDENNHREHHRQRTNTHSTAKIYTCQIENIINCLLLIKLKWAIFKSYIPHYPAAPIWRCCFKYLLWYIFNNFAVT